MGKMWHDKYGESRSGRKARLIKERRWDGFIARRKEIADEQGISGAEADTLAYQEFLPGSAGAGGDGGGDTAPGDDGVSDGGPGDPEAAGVVVDAAGDLRKGGEGHGGTSNILVDVEWVYHHIGVSYVSRETAPSAVAWALLEYVNDSTVNQSFFYSQYHAKLLPSRQDLERDQQRNRASRDVERLLDQLIAESEGSPVLPSRPEDDGGEPAMAEGGHPEGRGQQAGG